MKTKTIITIASISTLSLFLSMSAQAEIYKWSDSNGGVHYTATPPAQSKKKIKSEDIETTIRAQAGKSKPVDKEIATANDDSSSPDENNNDKKVETELAGPDKKLKNYCKSQRNNLVQLKKNFRNVWIDVKGEKTNLTQEQRKQKVDYLKTRIKEDCAGVKTES